MIDVDERGRSAAADLSRAARSIADTDAAWDAVLAGRSGVDVAAVPPRRHRWVLAGLAAAAAVVMAVVGVVAARDGGPDRTTVVPASPVPTGSPLVPDSTAPGRPTPDDTDATASSTVTTAPAPNDLRAVALVEVADADRLPALVTAGPAGATVDGRPVAIGSFDLAVQAADGTVLLGPGGGGPPLVAGDPPTELWPNPSWIGTPVLGDVADGADPVVFTISCGAGPQCRNDVFVGALANTGGGSRMRVGPSRAGVELPVTFGRMSVSDTGLIVGVSTWDDGRLLHPVVVMPGPPDPDQEPSDFTILMERLGLDTGTYNADEPDRPSALTVDQTGRVVAWLDPVGVHLVDIGTGDRRTIPLVSRPHVALPVLDVALTDPGLTSGAVLISAPGQPALVLDLADESLTQIPGFTGTVTFGAA